MFSMFRQRCVTNRLWETKMPRSRKPVRSGISNPALWCFRFRAQNLANHLCPPPTKHREKDDQRKKRRNLTGTFVGPPELMNRPKQEIRSRKTIISAFCRYAHMNSTPPSPHPPAWPPLLLILLLPRRSQSASQQPSCWKSQGGLVDQCLQCTAIQYLRTYLP